LGVLNTPVVDAWSNFLDEEGQQTAGSYVSKGSVQVLADVTLDREDGLLSVWL
jgi:hypothetical protein